MKTSEKITQLRTAIAILENIRILRTQIASDEEMRRKVYIPLRLHEVNKKAMDTIEINRGAIAHFEEWYYSIIGSLTTSKPGLLSAIRQEFTGERPEVAELKTENILRFLSN